MENENALPLNAVQVDLYNQLLDDKNRIQGERDELLADMKLLKNNIMEICKRFGIAQPDGTFRQTVSLPKILSNITPMFMWSEKKINQELDFLISCKPLLEKYQDL